VEVSTDKLERYTDTSSETQSQSSPSAVSLEQARTLWQQQCYCETCRNRRTPKLDASETRCRLCSRWRQFSKPKARLLDVEELPPKSAISHPKTKRRCQSISSHPLEGKRPRSFSPSTISVDTTRDATVKRIDAVSTGTRKSAVTAPIAAGGTTAHPDKVVAPGVYPLVVDPIIVNTRLSKVLMDGGSSLNIIYLETLDLLGIDRARLQRGG